MIIQKRSALNQSFFYAAAIILQHMVSIIMLPIYTRYLTPGDYGIAELLSMGVDFVGMIFGVVSAEAIFRFYHEDNSDNYRKKVVYSVFVTALVVNLLGYLLIIGTSKESADYLFDGISVSDGEGLVILYGATIIFQVMSAIPMAYLRAEQKPALFLALSALRLVVAISCNVYFVVYKEMHIEGVVYAVFTFTLIHSVICSAYMLYKIGISFSVDLVKKSISFSWPLMFSSIALFLTTYADRLFIKSYSDNVQLGLYALAYKFGFIMISLAWMPFSQFWEARRYQVVKEENAVETFQKVFRLSQTFVIVIAFALAIYTHDLLRIMASPGFHEAYTLAGIIILAYIFNIWSQFCLFGILYANKTLYKAYIDSLIFVVAIALYALTIPKYGALGAAISTLLSLMLRLLLINYYSSKLYDMKLEWKRAIFLLVPAIFLYLISVSVQLNIILSIIFNAVLMFVFIGISYFGYGLTDLDRQEINNYLGNVVIKVRTKLNIYS